jgi:hypothetical protein
METDTELAPLKVEGESTTWVAFAPDGARLAVGQSNDASELGAVTLWDWVGRRRLATLDGHRGRVTALTFSSDGTRLAAGGSEGLVTLWDVTTGREPARLRAFEPGAGSVVAVAFSPDGTRLATAGHLEPDVRLWDSSRGEPRGTIPATSPGVQALAFAPSGRILALANMDGTAALWDVATARELGVVRAEGRSLYSLAFSREGRWLATGGADGAVRRWDMAQTLDGKRPVEGSSTHDIHHPN